MTDPIGLLPFIPGGKDFQRSREFFAALGFREEWSNGGYVGMAWGDARFILQDFDNIEFASNLMAKIEVPNLDAWWADVEPKQLEQRFEGVKIKPPTTFPWGREVNIIDLAGVCWHIGVR